MIHGSNNEVDHRSRDHLPKSGNVILLNVTRFSCTGYDLEFVLVCVSYSHNCRIHLPQNSPILRNEIRSEIEAMRIVTDICLRKSILGYITSIYVNIHLLLVMLCEKSDTAGSEY